MLEPMLTPRQKAAVIVRLLIGDGEKLSLERLPQSAQAALAHEMAVMSMVDRTTRDQVVEEFCESLEEVGLTFPEGMDSTLEVLDGTLSQDTTDRLRRMAAVTGGSDPWERIAAMQPDHLRQLAETEATEIAAVMFSKLPVPKAAGTFALISPARARQIAYAMSLTGDIEAPALRRIGIALLQAAESLARPAMDGGPVEKVGAILNFTTSGTRDEVLSGLDEDDANFAQEVRKSIFTWVNIPKRVDPRDIPRITREVEPLSLQRAIRGAKNASLPTAEFILSSMSSRMADSLREEAEALGRVTASEAEDAMTEIVAAIRRMEDAGELFLIAGEAADEAEGSELAMKSTKIP
ncbi:flagellar motor switch protein FliG [Paracoccus aerodenitrificans]|uniref:flagellar motor switch protein FliG n=1 Tax=Paracoccus aerodenitrificans TaxID=3017781 RepID=UPI0022F0D54D|nr:FliG C-terminal domain-containing protein [Paracoccus aerodenitrificans]WBU63362.1 flagellar motor switch protein FliG [Paracoccus aerodenitrificans]